LQLSLSLITDLGLLVFFYAASISGLHAETAKEIAEKAHLASINTLLIFTSQEGLSTGRYNFTDVGVDMEIYKLPFTYHFGNWY
jgi:hypothetical protein